MSIPSLSDYVLPTRQEYPAAKVDWKVDSQKSALLIHDMQEYFVNFYDREGCLIEEVIQNIGYLKQWCRQNDVPVYYTAQSAQQRQEERGLLNDMWGPGLTAYPEQAGIVSSLLPDGADQVLTKWRYSAFYRSDLAERLADEARDQLIICGVYAHIGVLQTAADAFMRGIQPFVIANAVADFSHGDHLYALQYVQRNLGVVNQLDEVIKPAQKIDRGWVKS